MHAVQSTGRSLNMANPGMPKKSDGWMIAGIALVLVCIFAAVATLPLIALYKFPPLKDGSKINDKIAILGTYGDMFGMLNSVFSGAALTGAIYAVILQRREHKENAKAQTNQEVLRMDSVKREAWVAQLNATHYVAQLYTSHYLTDPKLHDGIFKKRLVELRYNEDASDVINASNQISFQDLTPEEQIALGNTVKCKMLFHRGRIEHLLKHAEMNYMSAELDQTFNDPDSGFSTS
jgi:hypothetical protein